LYSPNCVPEAIVFSGASVDGNTMFLGPQDRLPLTRVALSVTTASLPVAAVKHPYSAALTAKGGLSPYYVWRLAAGSAALPKGLTLNELTGVISGKPAVKESITIEVQATSLSLPAGPAPGAALPRS
jgi:hypothetical protein